MLIQEYNPEWMQNFEDIKSIIQDALGEQIIRIEHVGSTSIPGLAAKPIIDMDIVFPDYATFDNLKIQLSKIGYYHNGDQGIPKREAFKRVEILELKHPVLDNIKHHLYACPLESEELNRHILFRDFLKDNKWAREAYQKLKYQIADETNQDQKAYAQLKEVRARDFILSILKLARKG